jgi:hypothetical protein
MFRQLTLDVRQAWEDNPSLLGISAVFSPLRFSGSSAFLSRELGR